MNADPSETAHPDLASLLACWYSEEAPDSATAASWLERLRSDEVLRRQFAAEIHLAGLTRTVQAGEPRWLRIEEELGSDDGEPTAAEISELEAFEDRLMGRLDVAFPVKHRLHVSASSSWLAAAAGLVIGLFGASVVWAITNPKAVATASRLFALVDGSFEKQRGHLASGFPSNLGLWSGDEAEVVDVATVDGVRALRFVRAEREAALPNYGAASCDVYQLVDLRSLKADVDPGEATLELSARFLDSRQKAGEKVKFICRLYAFSGTPDVLPAEWPLSQKEALAAGSGTLDSFGGAPATWQTVSTKVLLPPGADFAVIHLVVHKPKNPAGTEALFGDQFADDVRLTLKTQPTLPVRLAQR
jgi:hypothetical protein